MRMIEIERCKYCPFLLPPDIRDPQLIYPSTGLKSLGRRWDDDEHLDERERPHICIHAGPVGELSLEDLDCLNEEDSDGFPDQCPLPEPPKEKP